MDDYLIGIGKKIRELRKEKNLYANEVARRAGVSSGLISKIENGRTIPSLAVFFAIVDALEEEPAQFLQQVARDHAAPFVVIRPDDQYTFEKEEEAEGFRYDFIFSKRLSSAGFEAVLLTLEPGSQRARVVTEAFEFKYVLEGACEYDVDGYTVTLCEGDVIFFDGRLPHVPRNRSDRVVRLLVIYMYTEDAEPPDRSESEWT